MKMQTMPPGGRPSPDYTELLYLRAPRRKKMTLTLMMILMKRAARRRRLMKRKSQNDRVIMIENPMMLAGQGIVGSECAIVNVDVDRTEKRELRKEHRLDREIDG